MMTSLLFDANADAQTSITGQSPQTNLVPIGPPPTTYMPGGSAGFDPYATSPQRSPGIGSVGIGAPTGVTPPAASYPSTASPAPSLFGGLFSQPASSPSTSGFGAPPAGFGAPMQAPNTGNPYGAPAYSAPNYSAPTYSAPSYGPPSFQYDNPNVYGPPAGFGSPQTQTFPNSIYPSSSPSTLFPEGLVSGSIFPSINGLAGGTSQLLRGPRLRNGFVGFGDNSNDLNMNDTDASVVFAFPNFFYSNQPLYVVPSFSLHLWDGPKTTVQKNADLPGSAYSAFLDLGWNSDPNQMVSTELGIRVGAFTDFDTFNSDSIRILGKALASFRLTPTSTLKGGVYYLDRNELKIVPAFGVLCQPNPYTRVDLFFPQPKFARYLRTVGTQDVWWYLSGDYGGGSWTVTRADGSEDSIDINDLRAVAGLEWGRSDEIRAGRRLGFAEIGYVFNRELRYRNSRIDNVDLDDGIMFRLGIGY
ncbi:MAG: hypothetical protein WBD31_07320 [Rubripirellula sp.]